MTENPLLRPWSGPLGGVPPFDTVDPALFEDAMREAMERKLDEIRAIRDCAEAPDFANTVEAVERAGQPYERVQALYYEWLLCFFDDAFQPIAQRLAPAMSELHDRIYQDPALYDRFQVVAEQEHHGEERRLIEKYLRQFRRAGAHLGEEDRERVAAINARLSSLYTAFSERLLADEKTVTWLGEDDLDGLSSTFLGAAQERARAEGQPDRWAVANTRSAVEPFLESSTRRDLRERVWRRFYGRGDGGGNDTRAIAEEIIGLRQEKAKILGYPSHAHLQLADTMAGDPERIRRLLRAVWEAASRKFEAELAVLQRLADADGITIAPWDVRFYAARVKRASAIDTEAMAAHFQLGKLVEGMFWAAGQLYGWRFVPVDLPVPHPDVKVWRVERADGQPQGLFYFDPFARDGKRSGAWMMPFRIQDGLRGEVPIVSNTCNFMRAPAGRPTTLGLEEARTLFHEFGHAIHGLASATRYPSLAGTQVVRDFVEFPSQLNEHWLFTPELLQRFALHADTGEPLDPAWIDELKRTFNLDSGFRTLEYLACAVVDLELHLAEGPVDLERFEKDVLERWGLNPAVVMRHRTPQFAHIFAGEAYSAGYSCYLWADMLVADAAQRFAEAGFYDRDVAAQLMEQILSRGDAVDPMEAFCAFRGREPSIEPLLRDRGFIDA